jgi:murein DD-endopeptidase MepM/ murein hydrolase activator NlpD
VALCWLVGPQPALAAQHSATTDFSAWHLPVPAGEWLISRGPCEGPAPFDHNCNYYEERCAIDLIPVSGSMEHMPVLAPQAGQVFFMGQRDDAGLTLMLLHPDGRVSGFMHLSKVVVGVNEEVAQGQVVAYAGRTGLSSGNPHLHFFVQPNAVERACLPLEGLDTIDYLLRTVWSDNLGWDELMLADPPQALVDQLPPVRISQVDVVLSTRLILSPGYRVHLPLAFTGRLASTLSLQCVCGRLTPIERTETYTLYKIPLANSRTGNFTRWILSHPGSQAATPLSIRLQYTVRPEREAGGSRGILLLNPSLVSPEGYGGYEQSPELCWDLRRTAGQAPFEFRALVVGSEPADSGWITGACWQPPDLKPGTYYWKVFVRDARGYMNRTNQRPFAFIIR